MVKETGYGGVSANGAGWAAPVGAPVHPTGSAVIARFNRAIQYAAAAVVNRAAAAYWIAAFAGMTTVDVATSRAPIRDCSSKAPLVPPSLRAQRSNPGWWAGLWIASSLRSSQ
ncbi:predicted protein [Bradyrhizobium oligotrophicum S58]|uniref:Uncharacterized protein n=1 Tax=Bradyrhizobium oligotrophicum S58 TaxID=1245469 RepID=M4Z264_9BRAD|nr:predicted protein [Bradyrhizobium oligotrophicum S58]